MNIGTVSRTSTNILMLNRRTLHNTTKSERRKIKRARVATLYETFAEILWKREGIGTGFVVTPRYRRGLRDFWMEQWSRNDRP